MEDLANGMEFTFIRETNPPKNIDEILISGKKQSHATKH